MTDIEKMLYPVLLFDTETSGLPIYGKDAPPADHPSQPHILQLGAGLIFADPAEDVFMDRYVKPAPGMTIDPGAAKAHGITMEVLHQLGLPLVEVLDEFEVFYEKAPIWGAFNMQFDSKFIRGARRRCGRDDRFGEKLEIDVMLAAAVPCNIPPTPAMLKAGRNYPKSPKLEEAVQILLGRPFGKEHGAHNALADVKHTAEIYRWLAARGHINPAKRKSYPDHKPAAAPKGGDKSAPSSDGFGTVDTSKNLDAF